MDANKYAIVIEVNNKNNNNQCDWCQHLKAIGVVLLEPIYERYRNVFVCRECFEKSKEKEMKRINGN